MPVFEDTGRESIGSGNLLGGGIVFRPPKTLTPLADGDGGDGGDPDCTGCEQPDPPECCYYVVESIGTLNYDSPFGFDAEHGGLIIDMGVARLPTPTVPTGWIPGGGGTDTPDPPMDPCEFWEGVRNSALSEWQDAVSGLEWCETFFGTGSVACNGFRRKLTNSKLKFDRAQHMLESLDCPEADTVPAE